MTKIAGYGSISQRHGSADPDPEPHQSVMDPEHRFKGMFPFYNILYNITKCTIVDCSVYRNEVHLHIKKIVGSNLK
jgi:hypothetical protein